GVAEAVTAQQAGRRLFLVHHEVAVHDEVAPLGEGHDHARRLRAERLDGEGEVVDLDPGQDPLELGSDAAKIDDRGALRLRKGTDALISHWFVVELPEAEADLQ